MSAKECWLFQFKCMTLYSTCIFWKWMDYKCSYRNHTESTLSIHTTLWELLLNSYRPREMKMTTHSTGQEVHDRQRTRETLIEAQILVGASENVIRRHNFHLIRSMNVPLVQSTSSIPHLLITAITVVYILSFPFPY